MPLSIKSWGVVPKNVPKSQPPLCCAFSCTMTSFIPCFSLFESLMSPRLLPIRTRWAPSPWPKLWVRRTSRSRTLPWFESTHVSRLRYSSIATDSPFASSACTLGFDKTIWIESSPPTKAAASSWAKSLAPGLPVLHQRTRRRGIASSEALTSPGRTSESGTCSSSSSVMESELRYAGPFRSISVAMSLSVRFW